MSAAMDRLQAGGSALRLGWSPYGAALTCLLGLNPGPLGTNQSLGMESSRETRSGRIYSPWKVIPCSQGFDYDQLLHNSTLAEPAVSEDDILAPPTAPAFTSAPSGSPSATLASPPCAASTADPVAPLPTQPSSKKAHALTRLERRKLRLQQLKTAKGVLPTSPYLKLVKSAPAVRLSLDCEDLPAASGAYCAKPTPVDDADKEYSVEELKEMGFAYVPWDGCKPMVAVDSQGRVCVVFAGKSEDPAYSHACHTAHNAMEKARRRAGFKESVAPHRRGRYPTLNVGVIHGKGTLQPINVNDHNGYAPILDGLLGRTDVQRLASFASKSLAAFAPKLYGYYQTHLSCLFEQMPDLRRIFPEHISVFPSAAFNFGPNVCTFKHRDLLNCPFGLCAIQALGNFDPTLGGHMVLWEPRLIVEFPPGSVILIPSATITHSNIPVKPGSTRSSFTQYASGGLFRYVDYGFKLENALKQHDPKLYEIVMKERMEKWRLGLDLMETVQVSGSL